MDFVLELAKLIKQTPKHHLPMQDCENCPYNSFLYKSKDCYLCFSSSFLETCFYLDNSNKNRDCVDCDYITNCELCYESIDCNNSYNCNFCRDCKNCIDSDFCYECYGCRSCFCCVGLNKKEFFIFNQKYSPEQYPKEVAKIRRLGMDFILEKQNKLRKTFPHPYAHVIGCENSFGDYLFNAKNCYMCFNAEKSQDSIYCFDEATELKDCVDCSHVLNSELVYNSVSIAGCYNINCSWWAVNSNNCEYGFCNIGCGNCFGCVNIKRREYNILNQQHSKEDYFKKTAEIKDDLRKRGLHGKYLVMDAVELAKTL